MSLPSWTVCRLHGCEFSITPAARDETAQANIMCAHYQGHIAQDLHEMKQSQLTQLAELRAISSSGFLNPRGPGETPDDVQERIERRRHPARG